MISFAQSSCQNYLSFRVQAEFDVSCDRSLFNLSWNPLADKLLLCQRFNSTLKLKFSTEQFMQIRQRFASARFASNFKFPDSNIFGCCSKKRQGDYSTYHTAANDLELPGRNMSGDIPVRPPMWDPSGKNPYRLPIDQFLAQQGETLKMFKKYEENGRALHGHHFDWWMFPIDDGSRPEYNVKGESDVEEFRNDEQMMKNINESWRRACHAWGWDFENRKRLDPMPAGCGWTDWDVRLTKMIRTHYFFKKFRVKRHVNYLICLHFYHEKNEFSRWLSSLFT